MGLESSGIHTIPQGLNLSATFEAPMAEMTASRISRVKRARFSLLLPYRSVRKLTLSLRNWSHRYPFPAACMPSARWNTIEARVQPTISTQSNPASMAQIAAWTWSATVSLISRRLMGFDTSWGTAPWVVKRFTLPTFVADELSGCRPPSWTDTAKRPVCPVSAWQRGCEEVTWDLRATIGKPYKLLLRGLRLSPSSKHGHVQVQTCLAR